MAEASGQVLFKAEYERELEGWWRRRFRSLCAVYLVLGAVELAVWLIISLSGESSHAPRVLIIGAIGRAIRMGVVVYFYFRRDLRGALREQMLGAASHMILALGAISLIALFSFRAIGEDEPVPMLLPLFFWHFSACLFLPWSPRESLRPFIPLYLLWAFITLAFGIIPYADEGVAGIVQPILAVIFGVAVFGPGLAIVSMRLSQHSESFRRRMVGQQFLSMRRELSQARQIHESMFPRPFEDDFVRFEYVYTPMREIGGDFIDLHVEESGLVQLTLLDVTGHGLAAALTVNRLYGELERIRAEHPEADPGKVITLLNRYINLTMARHNIYATGACLRLDPVNGVVHWASAGHPPMFRRGTNGNVSPLNATTVVLGALNDRDFDAEAESMDLAPGDTVVVYTDGVFEARDRLGRQLGLSALRDLLRKEPAPRNWPQFIAAAVEKHLSGQAEDDVLIASLHFRATRPQETALEDSRATP